MPEKQELGAGLYRVRKGEELVYRGAVYKAGDEVVMSDAGAGAHHTKVTKVTEPAKPPAKDRGPAKPPAGKGDDQKPGGGSKDS